MQKLDRLRRLHEQAERLDDVASRRKVYDDAFVLRRELVEEFLGFVELLVRARLLSVSVDGYGGDDGFTGNVGGDAHTVFFNSNICVHAPRVQDGGNEPLGCPPQ
jgi:hypothetical protein